MKKLLHFLFFFFILVIQVSAQSFHLIIVSDTKDAMIGESCKTNSRRIMKEFHEVACLLEIPLITYLLEEENASISKIKETLKTIKTSQNDICIFYYSGHGVSDAASQYPKILLKGQTLPLSFIHSELKQKINRLTISMADCCNAVGASSAVTTFKSEDSLLKSIYFDNKLATDTEKKENYKQLFLQTKGDIVMSGSIKGQSSYMQDKYGGFFTDSFISSFYYLARSTKKNQINWQNLLLMTREMTYRNSRAAERTQIAQFLIRLK
jgi:hypothetical protein